MKLGMSVNTMTVFAVDTHIFVFTFELLTKLL